MSKRNRAQSAPPKAASRTRHPAGWIGGAVLYGLAWPMAEGVNLSFLAWFAFVPLFVELEHHERFGPFALRAVGFMGIATLISCWWWFFNVPTRVMWMTWVGGGHEILLESTPLLLLFALRKKLPYQQALWALVLVWPMWEWLYNKWELSMGYALLANGQAGNIWLVQYVDLFGVWSITAWVVLFNVLLYRVYRAANDRFTPVFWKQSLALAAVMIVLPASYGLYRVYSVEPSDEILVTMAHTDFEPIPRAPDEALRRLERVVHLTDSAAYYAKGPSDLYVWPEAAISMSWHIANTRRFIYEAVNDWETPLLTGYTSDVTSASGDTTRANLAVLIPVEGDTLKSLLAYTKRRFVPFFEGLPYYNYLKGLPAVRAYLKKKGYYMPGEAATLLPLVARTGRTLHLGTPICHEQQFPAFWAEWARDGADLFVHISFESWFGNRTFQAHFVNIARLRAIENRRSIVRSSNGGRSLYIDAFGHTYNPARRREGTVTAPVNIYSDTTLYTRFPNLFVLLCLLGLLSIGGNHYVARIDRSRFSS